MGRAEAGRGEGLIDQQRQRHHTAVLSDRQNIVVAASG